VRISRLTLKDFRRYRDLEIELAPGITVVRGPNEAGKTSLQRALELVLTRKCTSSGADLDALRSWDADPEARPVIGLAFTDEDLDGSHAGSVEKAFRGTRGTVRFELDGEVVSDPTLADQALDG
jgi:recombinational DNA repair ATPase RecF